MENQNEMENESKININVFERYIRNKLYRNCSIEDESNNYVEFTKITGIQDENKAEDKFINFVNEMFNDFKIKKISEGKNITKLSKDINPENFCIRCEHFVLEKLDMDYCRVCSNIEFYEMNNND